MERDLRIAQLRHFLLVAEHRSFRVAAEQGYRSQPAISLAIRDLEQLLGATVFERRRRPVLTAMGEALLPLARDLVDQHDRLRERMRALVRAEAGLVTVAALPSVASQWLPKLLGRFRREHPGVAVRVLDDTSKAIHERVASGEADFGVASDMERGPALDFESLLEDQFGVMCPRGHPLTRHKPCVVWTDLGGYELVANPTMELLRDSAAARHLPVPHLFLNNMISLIANVEGGAGVTVLPELAFPRRNARVVFRRIEAPAVRRGIGLVKRSDRALAPAAQAMWDLVGATLRQGEKRQHG